MAAPKHPPQTTEIDLEATAELPVPDFTDSEQVPLIADAATTPTDVFAAPVLPAGMAELADSLREIEHRLQRKIERVAKLSVELQQTQQQLSDTTAQRDQARQSAAEREAALGAELAASRSAHADLQLQQSTAQEALLLARAQLQEQRAALTESQQQAEKRERAQHHLEQDRDELRRRTTRHFEALTTWQGFRAVSASQLAQQEGEQQQSLMLHATELSQLRVRQSQLEAMLLAAESAQRTQAEALRGATETTASLSGQLAERDANIGKLQKELAQIGASLRSAEAVQRAQDVTLRQSADATAALQAQLAQREAGIELLQREIVPLREGAAAAQSANAQFDAQQLSNAQLRAELEAAAARAVNAEERLRSAEERVRRLESEAHAGATLLGNLQQNIERLGREESGTRPALKLVPTLAVRALVLLEGGTEVVYPIGRRTSIGRTPENDIQIDTSFISRHHAVLLSAEDHCIVEDLNSTNGVMVNGRRVSRQILRDGDRVTIGKTEFRYQQRS
jgi:hypothetical protein